MHLQELGRAYSITLPSSIRTWTSAPQVAWALFAVIGVTSMKRIWPFFLLALFVCIAVGVQAVPNYDPTDQSAALFYDEARTVYLGNLARRQNGAPPLRWNQQLTHAARWYSWDSTENRPPGFCGHQDTQGNWPDYRAAFFGYQGVAGAENAFCGYVTPEFAINGWLDSPGHRANLLDPNSREVGLGYYRRADGRGYVTQDFGHDPVYPPLVIENEALNTASRQVNLYVYDREGGGGFKDFGPAMQMQLSNERCFGSVDWQPYVTERAWQLADGDDGWRTVYARTRDRLMRTTTVSDTIYYGSNVPLAGLGPFLMSNTKPDVTLYGLDGGDLNRAQFSLGWLADDTLDNFDLLWGSGQRVDDASAWGGTAFRLGPPEPYTESSAWVWTTDFFKDVPLVAYVRLKVADNSSEAVVARVSVTGGHSLELSGTQFDAADQYQEFPLAFTFPESETFLIFQFWRSDATAVTVDAVSIFTAPQPFTETFTWAVPGGNYRGQGVWVRYTDGQGNFSELQEASTAPAALSVSPRSLTFLAVAGEQTVQARHLQVLQSCGSPPWQVTDDADWLESRADGDSIEVEVDASGLGLGQHQAVITLETLSQPVVLISVPVTLTVVENLETVHFPLLGK